MGFMSLIAELGLNWSPFKQGFDRAGAYANHTAKGIGAEVLNMVKGPLAATAILAGTKRAFSAVVDRARELKEQSKLFGVGTDDIQILDKAAKRVGLSFEDLGMSFGKFSNARKEAAEGNKNLRKSFDALGYSLADVKDPLKEDGKMLLELMRAAGKMSGQAQRAALSDIFGSRTAFKMIAVAKELQDTKLPMFAMKSDDIDKIARMEKAFKRLGSSFKTIMAAPLAEFGDNAADILEGKLIRGVSRLAKKGIFGSTMQGAGFAADFALTRYDAMHDLMGGPALKRALETAQRKLAEKGYRDDKAEEDAKKIREAMHEYQNAQDALIYAHDTPDSGKVQFLQDKIARLNAEALGFDKGTETEDKLKAIERRKEILGVKGELEAFRQSRGDQVLGAFRSSFQAARSNDPLVQYGNLIGSDPSHDLIGALTDVKYVLERIERNTQTAKNLGNKLFPDRP